jgi:Domain of unknown function (DUF4932)
MKRRIVIALLVAAWPLLLLPRSISGQPMLPPAHGITVTIDPRIELIATIQILYQGYPVVTQYDLNYKREVLKRFAPFENHPAVKLFQEMAPNGFNFGVPPEVMLYLSPQDLKVNKAMPEELVRRAGGKEKLMQFIDALRQFAKESNFMDFVRSHALFYQEVLSNERAKLKGIDVRVIEKYYGARQHTYNIILSPLLHDGGFGPRVAYKDGLYDVYSIMYRPLSAVGAARNEEGIMIL